MGEVTLTGRDRYAAVQVSDAGVRGTGFVNPRLVFSLKLRPLRPGWIELHRFAVSLSHEVELLATADIPSAVIMQRTPNDTHIEMAIPISDPALRYLEEQIQGDAVYVDLRFSADLHICDVDPSAIERHQMPVFPSVGGSWTSEVAGDTSPSGQALRVRVPRSDWFTQVLQSLGTDRYIPVEILIPGSGLGIGYKAASARLEDATQRFFSGDDPGVFQQCRGAIDALPGAKLNIYGSVRNEAKREAMDTLAKALGEYLHQGRHVGPPGGKQAGEFPVDHRDAAFALYATRLLVAYTSRLVVE